MKVCDFYLSFAKKASSPCIAARFTRKTHQNDSIYCYYLFIRVINAFCQFAFFRFFFSNVKVYHIVTSCASRIEAPNATCRFISRCWAPITTYRCQHNDVPCAASDWDGGTVAVFCGRNISVKYFRVRKHATCVLSQWFEAQGRLRCMRLSCRIIMYHRFAIFS